MLFASSITQFSLAVVFAVAGAAKLADLDGTKQAITSFGSPPALRAPLAILLPLVELGLAGGLLFAVSARFAAAGALVLLLIFSAAMVLVLLTGSRPDCNCFGGLAQTEVGRGALIRNLVLAAMAAFVVVVDESVSAVRWITVPAPGDRLAIVLMAVVLAGLAWFCWQLLRQNGRLLLRLQSAEETAADGAGLPSLGPGTAAPPFAGLDLSGEEVSLASLLGRGLPVGLFFTDPGCGACELVLDAVAESQRDRAAELSLAVISGGSIDRIEQKAARFGLDRVIPQRDESVFEAYGVRGFPAFVQIGADGIVAAQPALGADPVRAAVLAPIAPRPLAAAAR